MYDKYDQGEQSRLGKLGLLVCIIVAESQEDYSISEAQF